MTINRKQNREWWRVFLKWQHRKENDDESFFQDSKPKTEQKWWGVILKNLRFKRYFHRAVWMYENH